MAEHVLIAGERHCAFCALGNELTVAHYDFRTTDGRWAYGCTKHYKEHRMHPDLGTGKGQRLVYK